MKKHYVILNRENQWAAAYIVRGVTKDYSVRKVVYRPDGKAGQPNDTEFDTFAEACRAVKNYEKLKCAKSWRSVPVESAPDFVVRSLPHHPDSRITMGEMVQRINEAKRERYVFFKNVAGHEQYFQLETEYLAYALDDDQTGLSVLDDNGTRHFCINSRFASVELTEDAKVAAGGNCLQEPSDQDQSQF
jgi:hypothetical protein